MDRLDVYSQQFSSNYKTAALRDMFCDREKKHGWRIRFCEVVAVAGVLIIFACVHPRGTSEGDPFSVTVKRQIELGQSCYRFKNGAGRFPHCGMEIAAYLGDKNEDQIKDGWGNYFTFTHDMSGALRLSSQYTNQDGSTRRFDVHLEP